MNNQIDWHELLVKYMACVFKAETVSFITSSCLTEREDELLMGIEEEARELLKREE